mmetsp:Transcript_11917/g.28546  ORF Transcript_11917/g.28546 Transcript_11917/m.28546 type:complete len:513 (-) Transcript_11917:1057-2595(-)
MASKTKLDPLREFLDAVVTRIETLESHCGISGAAVTATESSTPTKHSALEKTPSARHITGEGETPAVKAFDTFLTRSVYPLADTCDDLNDMGDMGKLLVDAFDGAKYVVVLASRSKKPASIAEIAPHLKPITENVAKIRSLRLKREFDNHCKAIMEMLACMSWVTCEAPAQLPAPFVKECIGSSEFWSNRIRKDFKGKDAPYQIAFCDNMKKLLTDLAAYITEHHKTGLTFNPKGVSLAEAAIRLSDDPEAVEAAEKAAEEATKTKKRQSAVGNTVKGGNVMGMMAELAQRKNADGSSAATGLKKVSKDQQTWRKEFKAGDAPVPAPKPKPAPVVKKAPPKKKKGLPILEYQERGQKWVVENQTKESAKHYDNGLITIDVSDPKQQVYIYNCDQVTIKVNGAKFKSLIIDKCEKVNVVFDTIISGCEVVNSKKIGTQVDGVCPVFTIDKTVGVTVWLSEASCAISSFSTSLSSEMNVSIPDGDDRKEMPIPEQFVHKVSNGSLTSEVSDLYH